MLHVRGGARASPRWAGSGRSMVRPGRAGPQAGRRSGQVGGIWPPPALPPPEGRIAASESWRHLGLRRSVAEPAESPPPSPLPAPLPPPGFPPPSESSESGPPGPGPSSALVPGQDTLAAGAAGAADCSCAERRGPPPARRIRPTPIPGTGTCYGAHPGLSAALQPEPVPYPGRPEPVPAL